MTKSTSFFHIPYRVTMFIYRNKGLILIFLFALYMLLFDKFSVLNQFKIYSNLRELREEKGNYEQLIQQAISDKRDLEVNYEKFAREKYHMSRKDEDVFIIETRKKTKE